MKIRSRRTKKVILVPNDITLRRVVSCGQTAALKAAKLMNIKTGGSMPSGFVTPDGNKPGYSFMYNCCDNAYSYKHAIHKNVQNADATIRLGKKFGSKELVCCLNAVREYDKPMLDIFLEPDWMLSANEIAHWIMSGEYTTINIITNYDKELEQQVERFLVDVFKIMLYS